MRWNKIWALIFLILGILVGIVGVKILIKGISIYTTFVAIFFFIVCIILIAYGVKLYSIKGKRAFYIAMNELIEDLAGMISFV